MPHLTLQPVKTYATKENVIKAVGRSGLLDLRFIVMQHDDGRFFPVFIGQSALDRGVHFHFNILA